MATPKQAAQQLIEHLPELASWSDIMYELYVKQKIGAGLKAAAPLWRRRNEIHQE